MLRALPGDPTLSPICASSGPFQTERGRSLYLCIIVDHGGLGASPNGVLDVSITESRTPDLKGQVDLVISLHLQHMVAYIVY